MEKNNNRIFTTSFIFILIIIFTSNITMTMMMPIMPMYLGQLGQAVSLAGVVVGAFTFAALIIRPVWGKLIDTKYRKIVLIIGAVLVLAMCFAYTLADSFIILLIFRIIHGIGYSAITTAVGTIAADLVPPTRRSEGLGYYGVAFAGSLALGPALSIQISHAVDISASFIVAGFIAVVGFVFSVLIRINGSQQQEQKPSAVKPHQSFFEKSALPASLIMALVAFNYSAVMTFVSSYTISIGLGGMSAFFLVYAATLLVIRIFVGKYTDKHGMRVVLIPGIVSMALAFVILGIAKSAGLFILASVFFGNGYGAVQPTLNAIIISSCHPSRRGAANATFFSALDLGLGLGSVIWGILSDSTGYASIYWFGLIIFSLAVFFLSKWKTEPVS